MKKFLKSKIGQVLLPIVSLIIIVGLILFINSYPPSVKSLYKEFSQTAKVDYNLAISNLKEKCDGKGIFGKLETERMLEVVQMEMDKINTDFVASTGGTVEDYSNIKITNVKVEKSSSSKYRDILITVENNSSKSVRYIKINLYYKDDEGNIIKSEWTNDSATIKSGATQIINKMTEQNGWSTVSCEIDEVKFE